jgi:hypothetical protein
MDSLVSVPLTSTRHFQKPKESELVSEGMGK